MDCVLRQRGGMCGHALRSISLLLYLRAYIPRGVAGFPGSQYKPVVKILQNWGPLFFPPRQLWRMQEKTDTSATGADSMSWHVYSLDVPPAQNY